MGRPSSYTPVLAERVLSKLAELGSLRKVMADAEERGDDTMPDQATVYRWLAAHPEFREHYTRAREAADEPVSDEMERVAYDPSLSSDQKRVMIDTLKWTLARRAPRKWGDSVTLKGDKDNPLRVATSKDLDDAALAAIASGGLAEAT